MKLKNKLNTAAQQVSQVCLLASLNFESERSRRTESPVTPASRPTFVANPYGGGTTPCAGHSTFSTAQEMAQGMACSYSRCPDIFIQLPSKTMSLLKDKD